MSDHWKKTSYSIPQNSSLIFYTGLFDTLQKNELNDIFDQLQSGFSIRVHIAQLLKKIARIDKCKTMHCSLLFVLSRRVTKARKSLIIKLRRTLLLRSLEMNPMTFKTSTVVGVLLVHGLGEALLLRSPTVSYNEYLDVWKSLDSKLSSRYTKLALFVYII